MKRIFFILFLSLSALAVSAQFCANTLIVESADTAKFTLRVGGSLINSTPATRVVVPNIYSQDVNIVITFADPRFSTIMAHNVPVVRTLKKKENVAPSPYKAKYVVKAKTRRSTLKLRSITSAI